MRIGTMFLGTVDKFMHESIQTKFLVVGVPVIPLSSHYVLRDGGTSISGFEIPLHGKSVLLGYTRIAAWVIAAILGVFAYVEQREHGDLMWYAIGFLMMAVTLTFFAGGLSARERNKRRILYACTGMGAPADVLPADVRDTVAGKLLAQWNKAHDGRAWDRAIEDELPEVMLVAVAEYHGRPDLAERALATLSAKKPDSLEQQPYR
jgi:hypothetical protein